MTVQNMDPFLRSFIELYQKEPAIRDSLLVVLVKTMISKVKGHKCPVLPEKAINFWIALEATSRKAHDIASANLFGPCLRSIQRHNAKKRSTAIVIFDRPTLLQRLEENLPVTSSVSSHTGISLSFDGTKVPPLLQLASEYKAIVGGSVPNHFIDISDETEERVKQILADKTKIVPAKEIKVAVVAVQSPGLKKSPFFVLAGQTQTLNMKSNFNEMITGITLDFCSQYKHTTLVSVSADGVGCDSEFIRNTLIEFLEGKVGHVGLVDSNHNAKNFRYQWIGGSCVVILGSVASDPHLLVLAGIHPDIYRVKDWASDTVILEMASYKTVSKLVALSNSERKDSIALMSMVLYLVRLRLFAVNGKDVPANERISYLWISMIILTSFTSKSRKGTNQKNMLTNRRNLITETIALCFAISRNDVLNARYLTTEPNEHTFGGWRSMRREATVKECIQLEDKRRNKMNAIFESNLAVTRKPGKGYAASFKGFVDSAKNLVGTSRGTVEIDFKSNSSVVNQLWPIIKSIINSRVSDMKMLLSIFHVKEKSRKPFLRRFDTVDELLALYKKAFEGDMTCLLYTSDAADD